MMGLSRSSGKLLSHWEYFTELAEDALNTSLGSRQKQRLYGSQLPKLLGKLNADDTLMLAQIYATQTFIEPANLLTHLFEVEQVVASRTGTGLKLAISGKYSGQRTTFEVPIHAA
jgi:hypothetical protein